MSNRRIVLGMPGYGKQSSAAGRGFWRACQDMTGVWNYYQSGSLLASNFNQLWCLALNLVHRGERVDYFAMLHDDIGPEDYWLDTLIQELEDKYLDVLGVAVPIKDTRGMTSMALHRDGDNWMPHARLTMHDIYELPETFTSYDLNHPLLLNTGCFVVKWNQEWCKQVRFEINDRIVFNTACGRYQAQTEPEDWCFSRQLHEIGTLGHSLEGIVNPLRIGATRKIKVLHTGEMDFTNAAAWGTEKYDSDAVPCSPVPFAFPYDIPGWLHPDEGRELAKLADGKRVLEIGSYCGLSTVCMARTAESVTAVDYFDGRCTPAMQDTRGQFSDALERHGVAGKVTVCHPDAQIPLPEYDLAFIDGAHDAESVRADIAKVRDCLTDDGLIAFHDYKGIDPGVTSVVDELIDDGGKMISLTNTLAVVRPPAAILQEV